MSKTKYGIKLALAPDDWIWVTEPTGTMFDIQPVLFNSRDEAEEYALTWRLPGKENYVKVLRYRNKT